MTHQETRDLIRFRALLRMCGAFEDDSFQSVTISGDDATRTWHIAIGKNHYWAHSIQTVIDEAAKGEKV